MGCVGQTFPQGYGCLRPCSADAFLPREASCLPPGFPVSLPLRCGDISPLFAGFYVARRVSDRHAAEKGVKAQFLRSERFQRAEERELNSEITCPHPSAAALGESGDGDGASRWLQKDFPKHLGWVGRRRGRSRWRFAPVSRRRGDSSPWRLGERGRRWPPWRRRARGGVSPERASFPLPGRDAAHVAAQMEPRCGFPLRAASLRATAGDCRGRGSAPHWFISAASANTLRMQSPKGR